MCRTTRSLATVLIREAAAETMSSCTLSPFRPDNTESEVRLLVMGERSRPENRTFYPCNLDRRPLQQNWWDDHPKRALGPHDGLPDLVRTTKARQQAE
jgi:hypothetical protein